MKKRIIKFSAATIVLIVAGVLYYAFVSITGWAIPCPIHLVTHLYCPGCGVTGMFVNLLQLNFTEAFSHNCLLFVLMPFAIYFASVLSFRYIKYGNTKTKKAENIILYIFIGLFVVFGVLRNIPYFSFLAPY